MKNLASKIVLFSIAFLVLSLVIGLIAYDQVKYQPKIYTSQPSEFVCGNETNSSEIHQQGEVIFKANCAGCHKKYKDAYGPALKRFVSHNDSITIEYLSNYFKSQQELNPLKRSYSEIVSDSDSTIFVHQKYPNETEIIQLVEYISK